MQCNLMKSFYEGANRSIINATVPEVTLSTTEPALPNEENNNTDRPFGTQIGNTEEEPSGHAALWIAIVIFVTVGIVGLAEGFRRYRLDKCEGVRRRFNNVRENLF